MSSLSNYDDVFNQLTAFGLDITSLDYSGKMKRCKMVNGDRESRGWYILYEVPKTDGSGSFITGSFGVWQGAVNNAQKVSLDKGVTLSPEQIEAIKARAAADKKRQEAEQRFKNEKAAKRAAADWKKLLLEGQCDYLTRKQVGANGGRFSPSGNFAIPVLDEKGSIHGLQIIYSAAGKAKKGRDKEFYPQGVAKKGHFYQIGTPSWIVFIAEGFATAASIHEATGLPVVVAFDAGNLQSVAQAIAKKYPKAKIVIACDDDYRTDGNPGVMMGKLAALAVGGTVVIPKFNDERPLDKKGPTDFNDLAVLEGPRVVESQIADHLTAMGLQSQAAQPRARTTTGGEGKPPAHRGLGIDAPEDIVERFSLIYGGNSTCFDHQEHMLITLSDVRDACSNKEFVRRWAEEGEGRKMVKLDEVGFDPTECDQNILCNLWAGWPTTPKEGNCGKLLNLLAYLCSEEEKPLLIMNWVLKWLAYPIQHPGAKMKTAMVMHGPQGAGKNMFFEAVMAIYGEYGRIIDQSAIEDRFNDWASRKLFMIADEVVARQELFHNKNILKGLVTGSTIRINPKNVTAHEEKNQVNFVFLSNEIQPLHLERDDRRYTVIWTPAKLDRTFYEDVRQEIENGGIAALHYHLKTLDLGDFSPHDLPPMTKAKAELIELGFDTAERFWLAWLAGEIDKVPIVPCKGPDLYTLYKLWTARVGIGKPAPQHIFIGTVAKRSDCDKVTKRCFDGGSLKQVRLLWPKTVALPDGKSESQWLADCIEGFSSGVKNYSEQLRA